MEKQYRYEVDPKQSLGIGGVDEEEYLCRKGEDGWELCGVHVANQVKHTYYYWKREMKDEKESQ